MNRPHIASLALLGLVTLMSTAGTDGSLVGVSEDDLDARPPRSPGPLPFTGKARRPRPSGPPNRSREEARRRKQMARAGMPVVEPAPVDESACKAEEGGKR